MRSAPPPATQIKFSRLTIGRSCGSRRAFSASCPALRASGVMPPDYIAAQVRLTCYPAPTVSYLTVKEWGVKLPLSSTISDAYYVVPVGISPDADGQPSGILLGL